MDSQEEWLTTAELAKRWKMRPGTLQNWRVQGIGPRFFKSHGSSGRVLYRLRDIKAYEAENMNEGRQNG